MKLSTSFVNMVQLAVIIHTVVYTLVSHVSTIGVSAFPDSTSEPVVVVTQLASSVIADSSFTHSTESPFSSITHSPFNSSLAIKTSLINAGTVNVTTPVVEPTMIFTYNYSTSVFHSSKINFSSPTTILEPSIISSASQSYATPTLPSSSTINSSSTVTASSTTSEGLNGISSSSSNGLSTNSEHYNSSMAASVDTTSLAAANKPTLDKSFATGQLWVTMVTASSTTSEDLNGISSSSTNRLSTNSEHYNSSTAASVDTTSLAAANKPTPDKSFATRELWVTMELSYPADTNIQEPGFLRDLEINLAASYSKAREREVEKDEEVKRLLQNLNPEEDILLWRRRRRRRKRASSVDGNTAQIIDMSRNPEVQTTSVLVFYIMSEGANIPAVICATTFSELSVQELTLLMDAVVLSQVNPYDPVVTMASSPEVNTGLIITLSILIALAVLSCSMCCCCIFCVICGTKKKQNTRTMAPDTFRMIEFKQKFPYRPYTPNQNPRDYMEHPSDDDGRALETAVNLGGDMVEASSIARELPDGDDDYKLKPFKLPQKIPMTNGTLKPSVSEPPVTLSHQLRLANPNLHHKNSESEGTNRDLPHFPSSSQDGSDYERAQIEISQILEPDNLNKPRKKKRRKRQKEKSSCAKESALSGQQIQCSGDDDLAEPISETKRRVHALIEEAFSLVTFRAPPTTTVTRLDGQSDIKDSGTEEESKSINAARCAAELLLGRTKEFGVQTMRQEEQSQVVIVPVNVPRTEGASVIWSPYNARDELQRVSPTREPASLPGGVDTSPTEDGMLRLPSTVPRPHGYASSYEHHQPLDHTTHGHDYTLAWDHVQSDHISPREDYPNHFRSRDGGGSTYEEGHSGHDRDLNRYLTELEADRRERSTDYYDELDATGSCIVDGRRPSRSLLESIKAELKGSRL